MSEEDAIEVLENIKNSKHIRTELQPFGYAMAIKETTNYTIGTREFSAIETVLNLTQKQQEEIEKKDKIIDEMAKEIKKLRDDFDDFCDESGVWHEDCNTDCLNCIKKYFESKV